MDSVTIGTHESETLEFKVTPYEVVPPPPDLIGWWNSLPWWQKALVVATGIFSVAGAAYAVTKRK